MSPLDLSAGRILSAADTAETMHELFLDAGAVGAYHLRLTEERTYIMQIA